MLLSLCAVLAAASAEPVDYAKALQVNEWLRHPVLGDPSFDAFERMAGNPLHRGAPPYEWPVNGFFFEDPRSGNWYVYAGLYARDYAMGEGKGMTCTAYRSADRGKTWEHIGPVFPAEPFTFRGDTSPIGYAPDVSVVYDDGAYHMVYDWASANSTWSTMSEPAGGADNGIAYARAERPEGPFVTAPQPVYRTAAHAVYRGKYRRGYAATLLRRANDWLVLAMTDSGPNFSWAMIGMTAKEPQGPYSEPVFLRAVEDDYFHPPLMEFFPAFQYQGRIYAPATSVARNRNFQTLFSAPTERAHETGAWEIAQLGSLWHAEDVPHEHYGIWGQTFSGFVDAEGVFRVMFPSRDPEGLGTINLASRRWTQPYRDGFVLTGHEGPSLALLRGSRPAFNLDASFTLRGRAAIVWGYLAPLGPDKPASGSTLHPLSFTRHCGLEFDGDTWRVYRVEEDSKRRELVSGQSPAGSREIALSNDADGAVRIRLGSEEVWHGPVEKRSGAIGLMVGPNSHLEVQRFVVFEPGRPGWTAWLYTEGILGAGAADGAWEPRENRDFRYGQGALSLGAHSMAKWNYDGGAFRLWCPKGPEYGKADVWLDGKKLATLDLHAEVPEPSAPQLIRRGIPRGYHALVVRPAEGVVPIDSLDTQLY